MMMEILGRWNELFVIVLMMTGLYTVISSDNLVKKIIGLNLFQVSVIMFYVSMGKVAGGTAPILPADGHGGDDGHGEGGHAANALGEAAHSLVSTEGGDAAGHAAEAATHGTEAAGHGADAVAHGADAAGHAAEIIYSNPLPHVLMLTAIVVGVATTALGLSLIIRIMEAYGTVEEDEILEMDRAEVGL